jgi:hypothetical protein
VSTFLALLAFAVVFVVVAWVSERYTPLVGIGGLLLLMIAARLIAG